MMPKSGWYMKRHITAATTGATRIGIVIDRPEECHARQMTRA